MCRGHGVRYKQLFVFFTALEGKVTPRAPFDTFVFLLRAPVQGEWSPLWLDAIIWMRRCSPVLALVCKEKSDSITKYMIPDNVWRRGMRAHGPAAMRQHLSA